MKRRNGKRMLLGAFFLLLFGSVLGSQWGGRPVETAVAQAPAGRPMTIRKTYTLSGQPVAQRTVEIDANGVVQSETLHTIYTDHLGSATTLMDEQGNVVSTQHFFPFGEYRSAPTAGFTNRGFTGHLHNDDLGLIYMNARYYLPGVGRMLTPDTIVPDPANPQAWNRYTYVYNNPLKFDDPSGHFPEAIADIDGDSMIVGTSIFLLYAVAYDSGIYPSSVQNLAQNMEYAWERHDWFTQEKQRSNNQLGEMVSDWPEVWLKNNTSSSEDVELELQSQGFDSETPSIQVSEPFPSVEDYDFIVFSGYRKLTNKEVRKLRLHQPKQDLGLPGDADLYVDEKTGDIYYRVKEKGAPFEEMGEQREELIRE